MYKKVHQRAAELQVEHMKKIKAAADTRDNMHFNPLWVVQAASNAGDTQAERKYFDEINYASAAAGEMPDTLLSPQVDAVSEAAVATMTRHKVRRLLEEARNPSNAATKNAVDSLSMQLIAGGRK